MRIAIVISLLALGFSGVTFMHSGDYGGEDMFGATSFPTSLDTFTNPSATDRTNSPSHATQHANKNDAIEALEAKVGADGSAVTTSHDYKLSGVTGSDLACSLAGTETLTNKTLTSATMTDPYITDIANVDDITGTSTGSSFFNLSALYDTGSNLLMNFLATGSAVNYLELTNSATGNDVLLAATGTDATVDLSIQPKSTGQLVLDGLNWPTADGTNGQVIKTDGSGQLGWVSPSGVAGTTTAFTTMQDYSVDGSTAIMIIAKGDITGSANEYTLTLKYGSDTLDQVQAEDSASGDLDPFTLTYFGTPAATTTDITVTTNTGSIGNADITVLAF